METSITMKAKDLRIGNIINTEAGTPIIVSGWELYTMSVNENRKETNNTKPIPLTEEWVRRLDFEECINGETLLINIDNGLTLLYKEKGVVHLDNDYFSEDYIKVKYVHQVQNLYFALTSEELTIKK